MDVFYDFSRTKFQEYMSHQGFDHRSCHGDITLGFKYGSSQSAGTERKVPEVNVISDRESSDEVVSLVDTEGFQDKRLVIKSLF